MKTYFRKKIMNVATLISNKQSVSSNVTSLLFSKAW